MTSTTNVSILIGSPEPNLVVEDGLTWSDSILPGDFLVETAAVPVLTGAGRGAASGRAAQALAISLVGHTVGAAAALTAPTLTIMGVGGAIGRPVTLAGNAATFAIVDPVDGLVVSGDGDALVFPTRILPTLLFYAVEIEMFKPGATAFTFDRGVAAAPPGALTRLQQVPESSLVLRASDLGYRSLESDPVGLQVYPPILSQAFNIDRSLQIDPTSAGVSAAWGEITIDNSDGQFDQLISTSNVNRRAVRIYYGLKTLDSIRQYFDDPSYTTLAPVFGGLATTWSLDGQALTVQLQSASAWLTDPLQQTYYLGTGGLQGTADMAGQPIPIARGGRLDAPITNITPTLVDPIDLIYQYTNGPGTVVALFEGGYATFVYDGDVPDLYDGAPAPGHYRTCNALGLFQLGSTPVHAITADVTGAFPVAGDVWTIAQIAYHLLVEDLEIPPENIDADSFRVPASSFAFARGAAAAPPGALAVLPLTPTPPDPANAVAGVYFGSTDTVSGIDAVQRVLSGFGAALIPNRFGQLQMFQLRAPSDDDTPVATFDTSNIISVTPQPLPDALNPIVFRVRVAYRHNYTVQTSDISASATASRKTLMATSDSYAPWSSSDVLRSYRRPPELAPFGGALLDYNAALAVAAQWGALFGVYRFLFDIVLPVEAAIGCELGDAVTVKYPVGALAGGRAGRIVREAHTSGDSTITYRVLV